MLCLVNNCKLVVVDDLSKDDEIILRDDGYGVITLIGSLWCILTIINTLAFERGNFVGAEAFVLGFCQVVFMSLILLAMEGFIGLFSNRYINLYIRFPDMEVNRYTTGTALVLLVGGILCFGYMLNHAVGDPTPLAVGAMVQIFVSVSGLVDLKRLYSLYRLCQRINASAGITKTEIPDLHFRDYNTACRHQPTKGRRMDESIRSYMAARDEVLHYIEIGASTRAKYRAQQHLRLMCQELSSAISSFIADDKRQTQDAQREREELECEQQALQEAQEAFIKNQISIAPDCMIEAWVTNNPITDRQKGT